MIQVMSGSKTIRRASGAVCLIVAVLMVVLGKARPADNQDVGFIIYWGVCFIFAGLAMGAAVLDLGAVRREARQQQHDLLETTLLDIEAEKERRAERKKNRAGKGLQH
jgi:hypothetical protein